MVALYKAWVHTLETQPFGCTKEEAMNNYQHSFVAKASPTDIYAALTTSAGLRGWWTQGYEGETKVGNVIQFRFGDTRKEMRIEQLDANHSVSWLCTYAHINHDRLTRKDEWVGTQIVFRLTDEGKGNTR